MRAVRFVGGGRVAIEDVPRPEPAAGEVLVSVHSNALCGSDRRLLQLGTRVTPGHEIAGTVAEVGADVTDVDVGTPGVVFLVDWCGECYACRYGRQNMCVDKRAMYGFTRDGGLAEYVAVEAKCFLPVGDGIPLEDATALLDLFGTTAHALARVDAWGHLPSTVVVIGCGPIGLGAIACVQAAKPMQQPPAETAVYAIDVSPYRLALAEKLGATPFDAGELDPVAELWRQAPDGAQIAIEAAGLPRTARQGLDVLSPGGVLVVVAHSRDSFPVVATDDLIKCERAIVGAEYFPPSEFGRTRDLVASGALDPRPILTHRFPLERTKEACDAFFSGETGKVLVLP